MKDLDGSFVNSGAKWKDVQCNYPETVKLPRNISGITSNPDGTISVFKASCYWLLNSNFKALANYPKKINKTLDAGVWDTPSSLYGVPNDINAVLEKDGYLYIFYNDRVWKLDFFTKKLVNGWEGGKLINSVWPPSIEGNEIPSNINGVFYNYVKNEIWFIKGALIYKYSLVPTSDNIYTGISTVPITIDAWPDSIDDCFINEYDYYFDDKSISTDSNFNSICSSKKTCAAAIKLVLYLFKGDKFYRVLNWNSDTPIISKPYSLYEIDRFNHPKCKDIISTSTDDAIVPIKNKFTDSPEVSAER